MNEECPDCGAPPGDCWSQSGSMGQKSSCYRDKTVGYSRDDWLRHVAEKDAEIERLRVALDNLIRVTNDYYEGEYGGPLWLAMHKARIACGAGAKGELR